MLSLENKIIPYDKIDFIKNSLQGKKIVFTNGCFDILHKGHVQYLLQARELGDILWLGLNSDASVKKLKGASRPINSEEDRAYVLASLEAVSYITIFPEQTPIELLKLIQPQIHTKGGDYKVETLPETKTILSWGGEVKILPFLPGKSTTGILKKLEESSGK
ncbi:MAG: D-glycero-beta-D-manno-heptose 1-phosphate adenylyltransferase [Leptospira sp.]|nr:D-glycero-beta-D-manno-heptose 1-phosphate adenylyltransferase [Leptospira sp.]NCS93727.1 D-glycero-beta-D-manno-heptose 1-phosphate adenylyltransferase [Leptospira sp.]